MLPFELSLSEEDFVMVGKVSNQEVVVLQDFFGFDFEFVRPEDVEFLNLNVVFFDDSGFGSDKDVDVVFLDLFNSDFSFDDDLVLVLEEEFSVN